MITIKKNGKTVRLTESEVKNIINKQKIKKFLNEGTSDGPYPIPKDEETELDTFATRARNFLIDKYTTGTPKFTSEQKRKLRDNIAGAFEKAKGLIKKWAEDLKTEEAVKTIKE